MKKTISIALVCAMAAAMCAGCSSNKDDTSAGTEAQEALSAEKLIAAEEMPEKLPEGIDWYDYEENDGPAAYIEEKLGDEGYLGGVRVVGENIFVLASAFDWDTNTNTDYILKYDLDWNLISDTKLDSAGYWIISLISFDKGLYAYAMNDDYTKFMLLPLSEDYSRLDTENAVKVPDGSALLADGNTFYSSLSCDLTITDMDSEETNSIDLTAKLEEQKVYFIDSIIKASDTGLIFVCSTSANTGVSVDIALHYDIESGELTPLSEMDWIPEGLTTFSNCNGMCLAGNDEGFYKLDFTTKTAELVLSTNCTNSNRFLLKNSRLIYASDDKYIFMFFNYDFSSLGNIPASKFLNLTKSVNYEQGGKKVISVASTDPLDYATAEAIREFNDNSDSVFAIYDNRYSVSYTGFEGDGKNNDTHDLELRQAYSKAEDQLAVDIRAGEGPDVVIANELSMRLCNGGYFSEIPTDVYGGNDGQYFTNIFDASKVDGKVYMLPLSFGIAGTFATVEDLGDKQGMTFEEYASFVSGTCNGQDPIYDHVEDYSRNKLCADLVFYHKDLFFKDGQADFSNDAFKAILDYCAKLPKDAQKPDYEDPGSYEDYMIEASYLPAVSGKIDNYSSYACWSAEHGTSNVSGYPSIDGRSAMIVTESAAGIPVSSDEQEAASEFIKTLISPEIQALLNYNKAVPVCKTPFESFAKDFNDEQFKLVSNYDPVTAKNYTDDMLYNFEDMVGSASVMYQKDDNISLVIYEEIPPYLEGQKSFDEVAEIINNRVNLILSERD